MRDFYDSVASPKATLIAPKISNCNAPPHHNYTPV